MRTYYGLSFPFQNSTKGDYLRMTENAQQEIRANLIHLILTRKGSRFFLPEFGTRLYDFIFEQMDPATFSSIEDEIRGACKTYIPNLEIQSITVREADPQEDTTLKNTDGSLDNRVYRVGSSNALPYTTQVRIDYTITNASVFNTKDFVIINL